MWPRSAAAETARLEADILKVRAEQRTLQHQLEDAITTELRGLGMVDASRAIQGRCRRLIEEHVAAISSLQDELALLLPHPRKAADD